MDVYPYDGASSVSTAFYVDFKLRRTRYFRKQSIDPSALQKPSRTWGRSAKSVVNSLKWGCRQMGPDSERHLGQPASFEEKDSYPSAIEYLLGAVAGSLITGFASDCARAGLDVDDIEISISARLPQYPGRYARLCRRQGRI